MFSLNTFHSTAVDTLSVNPFTGTVKVTFWNTWTNYTFTKVSRRAILKAILKDAIQGELVGAGGWVNKQLLA